MDYADTTVIIPVKDEPAVGKVTKGVLHALPGCRVIVIYSGEAPRLPKGRNVSILHQHSAGKGMACLEAAEHVKTGIMCFIDGDDTYDPKDFKGLIAEVRKGADMALGDRMANISAAAMPLYIQFGNNILTSAANLLYGLRLEDSQTGIRAMKKKVFDSLHLKEKEFGIESEMNIKAKKNGCKIVELPASYYVRTGAAKHFKLAGGFKLFFTTFKFL